MHQGVGMHFPMGNPMQAFVGENLTKISLKLSIRTTCLELLEYISVGKDWLWLQIGQAVSAFAS